MSSTDPSTHPDSDTDISPPESNFDSYESESSDLLKDTVYDRSRSLLNDVVARLRDCGTDQLVNLPKIAVIGNQSSGKSSLIEAISQVKVPRSTGTCTRCPMEVILRRGTGESGEWNCRISLRMNHNAAGEKVGESAPIIFAETKHKWEVHDLLRGAQLAILNPEKDPALFIRDNHADAEETSLKFSPNSIVMEITGHSVDITFIDLPGIISSVPDVLFNWNDLD